MQSPVIETNNCIIKLLDKNQANLLFDYYLRNKSHLEPWEPKRSADFYSLKHWQIQVGKSLKSFELKQSVNFVALNKSQTSVIATCYYTSIVWDNFLACNMGYSIDESHSGKGLMFEISQATINYIKKDMKLHRIIANHVPYNFKSAKLLKNLGFEREGLAKQHIKIGGKWRDLVLNSLVLF